MTQSFQDSLGDYLSVASANAMLHAFCFLGRGEDSAARHQYCRVCPGPPAPDTSNQHWNAATPRLASLFIPCTTIRPGRLESYILRALVLTHKLRTGFF